MLRPLTLAYLCLAAPLCAQMQIPTGDSIPSNEALDQALRINVLTSSGTPFHAILQIASDKVPDPAFNAHIEVFWRDEAAYRLRVESSSFNQTLIVDNGSVSETNQGDFYPNWLRAFVTGLLDPIPHISDLRSRPSPIVLGPKAYSCVRHEDKPNGITNDLTIAVACFSGEQAFLDFALDFTYNMQFSDFRKFREKQIARTWLSGTKGHDQLRATLTTLEDWTPDSSLLAIAKATTPAERILTTLVSTRTEESMLESAPKNVTWRGVREGKLDGYMIVHATTDRTGQVREASKHNSDNPGLEYFGRELALKYKFKPLLVDGIPEQMEMPLVLHFSTSLVDPIPELDDPASRKMITGCSIPKEIQDSASAGQQIIIKIQISEDGHIMTLGGSDRKVPVPVLYQLFRACRFAQYKRDGVSTAYHANLTVTAR